MGWAQCPACAGKTSLCRRAPNRSRYQAAEAEFERRYIERETKRIVEGRIAPEGLGRREARQIIEWERRLAG